MKKVDLTISMGVCKPKQGVKCQFTKSCHNKRMP